ncbi:glycine/D-amino acid oxidase [Acetobacter nitrogenifigens DSM 23921 = NBRC 105050]|uniref:Oxidoreductase n=1 Tax=Acetobacter nitrogenifigens DSM 23921 = NBRC 105050 TaxID=1120919 RepID=A0A511XBK1_9PROT|nr:FAD-binding oxidoreductase [Acetobacter nitrogenifigens]GBQ90417.1 glycine/D-amino acid oxidase [Acetobacter nitrogenifigens DSM 23921 = NBRC 105050]GEN60353.1 oxidoreductase [Acetobacter nitrogenifigens DSM 23921 = NBRC 105050]
MTDVVVIGCGVSGAATAWELARSGLSVTIVDRYGPAAMASGWTLAGVRQSGRDPAEIPLAIAAVKLWENLAEALDAPTGYTQDGNLRIGMGAGDLPALKDIAETGAACGLPISFLDGASAVRDVAPAIAPVVAGATFCATDGHADPDATVNAYVAAARRAGATTLFGEPVIAVETAAGKITAVRTASHRIATGAVVLASGVMGDDLLAPFGADVPLDVKYVTVIRTKPVASTLKQVISVADVRNAEAACAGRQQLDGAFRFTSGIEPWSGAMHERNGRPIIAPPIRALAETIESFGTVVPAALDAEIDAYWCGLIDQTPDSLPVLDRVEGARGLFVARGFSGHGFCLGPITGKIMAALVKEEQSPVDISAFSSSRFAKAGASAFEPVTLHG